MLCGKCKGILSLPQKDLLIDNTSELDKSNAFLTLIRFYLNNTIKKEFSSITKSKQDFAFKSLA